MVTFVFSRAKDFNKHYSVLAVLKVNLHIVSRLGFCPETLFHIFLTRSETGKENHF